MSNKCVLYAGPAPKECYCPKCAALPFRISRRPRFAWSPLVITRFEDLEHKSIRYVLQRKNKWKMFDTWLSLGFQKRTRASR